MMAPSNKLYFLDLMAKIIVTDREGETLTVDAETGEPVMHALRELDHGVEALCGGVCSCATCHVIVHPDWFARLPEREDDELELLEELDSFSATSRLSCQVEFTEALDGLTLTVGPEE